NREALIRWFEKKLQHLRRDDFSRDVTTKEEPMINLVTAFSGTEWTLICYPRSRHRPSCYYAEGEAKLTVSPAPIDLSGVLVVPNPDHFARITANDVERIYAEVTLNLSGANGFCGDSPSGAKCL